MKWFWIMLLLCVSPCYGEITVTDNVEPHKLAFAKLTNELPEGVYLVDAVWSVTTKSDKLVHDFAPVGDRMLVFTGMAGTYTIDYDGIMLQDVTVQGVDGQPVTLRNYIGRIRETATFKVVGPNPPDPPEPNPTGKWQIMLFFDADQYDRYPVDQQAIFSSLVYRDRLRKDGHVIQEVLEDNVLRTVGTSLEPWFKEVRGDSMPRVALAAKDGGPVMDFALPETFNALLALLNDPKLYNRYEQYRSSR